MILCPSFYDGLGGGIGRVSRVFYDCLAEMGQQPPVWSANEPDEPCRKSGGRGFHRNYPAMMFAALRGLGGAKPAVIACMHLGLSPAARLLSLRTGSPYVVFLHGVEAWATVRERSRWGLAGAALLMANSRFTLEGFFRANQSLCQLPSVVTPLGIGHPVEPAPAQQGATRRILIVSRMDKADAYKGHRMLIRALGQLMDRFPGVVLTVAGDGDDRADIEAMAASLPYAANVEFLGRVPDERLAELYAQSRVFAMPSAGEGFGLVFLEAMAHGLPCVCGDTDAAREVVADGVTGFCVSPDDPDALAQALARLLADDGLCAAMGEAGRARYNSQFTVDHFKARVREALGAVARGQGS